MNEQIHAGISKENDHIYKEYEKLKKSIKLSMDTWEELQEKFAKMQDNRNSVI